MPIVLIRQILVVLVVVIISDNGDATPTAHRAPTYTHQRWSSRSRPKVQRGPHTAAFQSKPEARVLSKKTAAEPKKHHAGKSGRNRASVKAAKHGTVTARADKPPLPESAFRVGDGVIRLSSLRQQGCELVEFDGRTRQVLLRRGSAGEESWVAADLLTVVRVNAKEHRVALQRGETGEETWNDAAELAVLQQEFKTGERVEPLRHLGVCMDKPFTVSASAREFVTIRQAGGTRQRVAKDAVMRKGAQFPTADDGGEYVVETILAVRTKANKRAEGHLAQTASAEYEYLTRYQGFGNLYNQWLTPDHFVPKATNLPMLKNALRAYHLAKKETADGSDGAESIGSDSASGSDEVDSLGTFSVAEDGDADSSASSAILDF